jgi:hypothetical protein
MSAPIMHIHLAQKYIEKNKTAFETEEQKKSFIIGTLAPDSRYFTRVAREKTHETNITIDDIKKIKSCFDKGAKLHCLIDDKRAEFCEKNKIYKTLLKLIENNIGNNPKIIKALKEFKHKMMLFKLIEDEVVKNKVDLESVKTHFLQIHPEEKKYGPEDKLVQWHTFLRNYFDQGVTSFLKQENVAFINHTKEQYNMASNLITKLSTHPKIVNYVDTLVQHLVGIMGKP